MPTTKGYFTKTATAQAAAPQPKVRKPRATKVEVEDATVIHDGDPINPAPGSAARAEMDAKQSAFARLHETVHSAFTEYTQATGLVGPKQRLAAWVGSFVIAFGVGYIGGILSTVLAMLTAAITGSMFLSVMVYILGVVLTIYAGTWLATKTHELILSIPADAGSRIKARVTGWFSRGSEIQHA